MNEQEINDVLSNIGLISANELYVQYILTGYITLQDMMNTGNLDSSKRKEINVLIDEYAKKDTEKWNEVDAKKTKNAYEEYLMDFPKGSYVTMAKFAISLIEKVDGDKQIKRENLIRKIGDDINNYTPSEINDFIREGLLNTDDLINLDVPRDVIDSISRFKVDTLKAGEIPQSIPDGYTEIYFWGIPGSGKTCALAGILGHSLDVGILQQQSGPGYYYMNQLCNIFTEEIGYLPPPTDEEVTQYLPFHLKDNEGDLHPVALIELSGEIFKCYFKKEAALDMDSKQRETFDRLENYLSSKNKKIHFFVIDVSKNPRQKDSEGIRQNQYLDAASLYFKNNDVFKDTTKAIYIIATKSDTLGCEDDNLIKESVAFLKSNYAAFVNGLKDVCKINKINGKEGLEVIPFTLGKVYFNKICKFDSHSSSIISKVLQEKTSFLTKTNRFGFLNK